MSGKHDGLIRIAHGDRDVTVYRVEHGLPIVLNIY